MLGDFKMRKSIFLLFLVLGSSILVGCKGNKIRNQWVDQEIDIDGKFSDWAGINQNILEDQNIVVGMANDENNLYLMFRGNDERMARRIGMMGVTVWLNKEGKKKKDFGILYTGSTDLHVSYRPEVRPSDSRNQQMDNRMQQMMEKRRENLPKPGMIMIIQGEDKSERNEYALEGPAAGSAYENGVFCYEFKLPIPINIESGGEIKLGLELGGMSDEDRKAMMQEMGGMRGAGGRSGGGMGGRTGGGMGGRRGGGMGGRPGGMQGGQGPAGGSGLEKQEMWFTVVLADK